MGARNPDDTRRLLKVFGVAVTDFESQGAELTARIAEHGGAPDDELVGALRDLLELVADTNRRWRDVTDHLMEAEGRVLGEVIEAIAKDAT